MLRAALAGRETKKRIGRAPADEARCERYDPEIGPGGRRTHEGKSEDAGSRDDPDYPFHTTNVLFHNTFLLRSGFGCQAYTRAVLVDRTIPEKKGPVGDFVTMKGKKMGSWEDRKIGRWAKGTSELLIFSTSKLHAFKSVIEFR
jgi:hypothetical protein